MRILSFIDSPVVIKKILKHLGLWDEESARDPPYPDDIPDDIVYVPITDPAWDRPESPDFVGS